MKLAKNSIRKPFLTPEELKIRSEIWKNASNHKEGGGIIAYPCTRYENYTGYKPLENSIDARHGERFLSETIPQMLETRNKIKVLDIGGGMGLHAEQMRKIFGEDVIRVFTTGLCKKPYREFRRKYAQTYANNGFFQEDISQKPHRDDLQWRSLSQLSDFPEFDIILDTYGEHMYACDTNETFEQYFRMVAKKLLPGGHASISPLSSFPVEKKGQQFTLSHLIAEIGEKLEYEMGIQLSYHRAHSCVKIDKPENNTLKKTQKV
ncbi:MAG: hypothetical protein WCJ84_01125 [Candidatus Peregrinibacteria bacterium]